MFDAIKSILYLLHTESLRRQHQPYMYIYMYYIHMYVAPVQPAPGACHKNDLAPERPHPEHKNDITTSVVIKANCSSQHLEQLEKSFCCCCCCFCCCWWKWQGKRGKSPAPPALAI